MQVIVISVDEFLKLKEQLINSITETVIQALSNKASNVQSDWISLTEAKKILGYRSKSSWQKLRDEGKVVFTQSGRKIQYSKKSLENFLKNNKVEF